MRTKSNQTRVLRDEDGAHDDDALQGGEPPLVEVSQTALELVRNAHVNLGRPPQTTSSVSCVPPNLVSMLCLAFDTNSSAPCARPCLVQPVTGGAAVPLTHEFNDTTSCQWTCSCWIGNIKRRV